MQDITTKAKKNMQHAITRCAKHWRVYRKMKKDLVCTPVSKMPGGFGAFQDAVYDAKHTLYDLQLDVLLATQKWYASKALVNCRIDAAIQDLLLDQKYDRNPDRLLLKNLLHKTITLRDKYM